MSNINNHRVSMNKIELSPHLQELSCENAAAIQGGANVELYDDIDFGRPLLFTDSSYSYVGGAINDRVSSIRINSGIYEFWTDADFKGNSVTLGPGSYSFVPNVGLPNDTLSSFRQV
ncbi:beta/gamma crystallin-related protein [Nostoc sp.]|uniref:beta/gamma crystallin-related protein n=1 Tax=Nostoc sp. TaxID=1180 RepID=UPI002FF4522F